MTTKNIEITNVLDEQITTGLIAELSKRSNRHAKVYAEVSITVSIAGKEYRGTKFVAITVKAEK